MSPPVAALLSWLARRGVWLRVDGGRLRVAWSGSPSDAATLERIRAHRAALVDALFV